MYTFVYCNNVRTSSRPCLITRPPPTSRPRTRAGHRVQGADASAATRHRRLPSPRPLRADSPGSSPHEPGAQPRRVSSSPMWEDSRGGTGGFARWNGGIREMERPVSAAWKVAPRRREARATSEAARGCVRGELRAPSGPNLAAPSEHPPAPVSIAVQSGASTRVTAFRRPRGCQGVKSGRGCRRAFPRCSVSAERRRAATFGVRHHLDRD